MFVSVYSQEQTILIGHVFSDSLEVEGIHIYNKTSGKGIITNKYGEFNMPVKLNDTLLISGLQFMYQELIIDRKRIENNRVDIHLIQKINVLDEVTVRQHKLIGNLTEDSFNTLIPESKISSEALDFSSIYFSQSGLEKIDASRRKQVPIEKMIDPAANGGGSILGLVGILLSPFMDDIEKIGEKKRKQKKYDKLLEAKMKSAPEKIVEYLGESFFTETLKIPGQYINEFINYCKPKGLLQLFVENRKIEMIDLLIKESKNFIK